ncbi:helix-turn-helix transcriptional regulator, partial [Escherichia coli]|uniref:helix-turn-helix transcriptional regulator n=1 Tax=Escherichia coli TaxID=562 RepID=UPI0020173CA7
MLDNVCDYIAQWVEDNLDTGKNINDLIEDIGYSRKTVEVWFLNKYGVNIGEYLFKRRMSRASVLLKLTHLTITEIATLLHYSSSQNFARTFKRFSNKSPTEYRNSEAWDVTTLQHSFLYEFDIKNATRSTISSIFFHGVSYKINESFLYRNKTQDKKSLQYLIKNLLNEKKHDILVCISEFNSIDLDKSRKGIVNTLIKAGEVLNKTQEAVAVMPGGGVLT